MTISENYTIDEVYSYEINGIPVETGDLICTVDGDLSSDNIIGQFWWIVGKFVPGDVDHIVIYVGPEGRCVESGAKAKVITFEIPDRQWDGHRMLSQRFLMDRLYGVAYPLAGTNRSSEKIRQIRLDVARYCLRQAEEGKPYNLNFLNSDTEDAFYCSQLAYKAYIRHGIDLNTEKGVPNLPFSKHIVLPQEIWESCYKKIRCIDKT
ncbi:MAG TPA: hypothetical protein ENK58_03045 [Desulfobacterales bacterium]|nr:hypothetical protein [Desulfobacterales bacterium]